MYKGLFWRENLLDRKEMEVKYFENTLRRHFKWALRVFLWIHFQFVRAKWEENMEMVKLIGKCSLLLKRLKKTPGWTCYLRIPWVWNPKTKPVSCWCVPREKQEEGEAEVRNFWIRSYQQQEKSGMPHMWPPTWVFFFFSDNLTTLMFLVSIDLSEAQRGKRLTSSFSLKGVDVAAYTYEAVRAVFVELFCTPKSSM